MGNRWYERYWLAVTISGAVLGWLCGWLLTEYVL